MHEMDEWLSARMKEALLNWVDENIIGDVANWQPVGLLAAMETDTDG